MKKLLILMMFFFQYITYCQEDETSKSTWIYKIDVAQLYDVAVFPNVQVSVEKKITPTLSVIGGVGYQFYSFDEVDTLFVKASGFKINFETRYYIGQRINKNDVNRRTKLFVGIQGFYRANSQNESVRYYAGETENIFEDNFVIERKAYGLNVTLGSQIRYPKKRFAFILEPHLGFGIMNKTINNEELQYRFGIDENTSPHTTFEYADYESSSGLKFNLTIGLRIGFQLVKYKK